MDTDNTKPSYPCSSVAILASLGENRRITVRPAVTGKPTLRLGPFSPAKAGRVSRSGEYPRLLAQRGARMFAVDIAHTFVRLAADSGAQAAAGIHYAVTALGEPYT